jgi:hypothetical protein
MTVARVDIWNRFGWDEIAPYEAVDPDFLSFLYDSRLIYAIRAYQGSFADNQDADTEPFKVGVKVENGHPHLLKEGAWVRWDDLKDVLGYDRARKCIFNRQNQKRWVYTYPNGLTPATANLEPIYKLAPHELQRLQEFSRGDAAHPCYIQIFTTDDRSFLDRHNLGHVALRLIDQAGRCYSICTLDREGKVGRATATSFLSTYNIDISQPDYSEFHNYETRRVTTIPITSDAFNKALSKAQAYANAPFRFNFLHQNCTTFAAHILKEAGIQVDYICPASQVIWELLKDSSAFFRGVDKVMKAVLWVFDKIGVSWVCRNIIFWIPLKLLTVIRNSFYMIFGATKSASPLPPGSENEKDNSQRLTSFDRLISSPLDLFRDDLGQVHSSIEMVKWQLNEQKERTYIHQYAGTPNFAIVPPLPGALERLAAFQTDPAYIEM